MTVKSMSIIIETHGNADIIDITPDVADLVAESGVMNGLVTIFSPSATSAITSIEYESGCVKDFQKFLDEIIDPTRDYLHNLRWGDGNGHSHLRAALLGASFTIPLVDGRLTLGAWQQIVFMDFDVRSRHRELIVQIVGD